MFMKNIFSKTKIKFVKTDIDILDNLLCIWLNERLLDPPICFCIQSFEITHHVASGTLYNDERDDTEKGIS